MSYLAVDDKPIELSQLLDYGFLDRSPHILPGIFGDLVGETAFFVDRIWWKPVAINKTSGGRSSVVVGTKRRGLVYQASSAIGFDVISIVDVEPPVFVRFIVVLVWRNVLLSIHVFAFECIEFPELGPLGIFVESGKQVVLKNVLSARSFVPDLDVGKVRVGGNSNVRRYRPRSCCPDQETSFGLETERKCDHDCRILGIFAILVLFEITNRCAESCREGHDSIIAINLAFVVQLLKGPPNRFHVAWIYGQVLSQPRAIREQG
jgi:hypothetical protein